MNFEPSFAYDNTKHTILRELIEASSLVGYSHRHRHGNEHLKDMERMFSNEIEK